VSLTRTLYRMARLSADARAVRRRRVRQRLVNKAMGRQAGRILNRLWR
jgi:hypothetical protein